jgi:hypothetical protein
MIIRHLTLIWLLLQPSIKALNMTFDPRIVITSLLTPDSSIATNDTQAKNETFDPCKKSKNGTKCKLKKDVKTKLIIGGIVAGTVAAGVGALALGHAIPNHRERKKSGKYPSSERKPNNGETSDEGSDEKSEPGDRRTDAPEKKTKYRKTGETEQRTGTRFANINLVEGKSFIPATKSS